MKILLIEDHKDLATNIISFLSQENYVCECATTIAQAKDLLTMFDYECILLDITLPDGTGWIS